MRCQRPLLMSTFAWAGVMPISSSWLRLMMPH